MLLARSASGSLGEVFSRVTCIARVLDDGIVHRKATLRLMVWTGVYRVLDAPPAAVSRSAGPQSHGISRLYIERDFVTIHIEITICEINTFCVTISQLRLSR